MSTEDRRRLQDRDEKRAFLTPADRFRLDRLGDDEVLARIRSQASESQRGKFELRWLGDLGGRTIESARASLVQILAFWCDRDFGRMDRLFRRSRLMSGAWDRPSRADGAKPGETLGEWLIGQAIDRQDRRGGHGWRPGDSGGSDNPALCPQRTQVCNDSGTNTPVSGSLRGSLSAEVKGICRSCVPDDPKVLSGVMLKLAGRLKKAGPRGIKARFWIQAVEYWRGCVPGCPPWAICWKMFARVYDKAGEGLREIPPLVFYTSVEPRERVIGAARHFSDWFGEPFSLSVRQVAAVTGMGKSVAAEWLAEVVRLGWLVVVKEWPRRSRKATEYAFPDHADDYSSDRTVDEVSTQSPLAGPG